MSEEKKRVEGAIEEPEINDTERQAIAAVIGVEMRGVLRADATTVIGIAARYQHYTGARSAVKTLLEAYAELMQLDPESLRGTALTVADGTVSEEPVGDLTPNDGRLHIRATEASGVLLSELLVAGGFVRTEQSARAAFRSKVVHVDGAIVTADMRLAPSPLTIIKVGDQDAREVVITGPAS